MVQGANSQCHEFVSGTALLRIVRVVWEFPRASTDSSQYQIVCILLSLWSDYFPTIFAGVEIRGMVSNNYRKNLVLCEIWC